MGSKGQTTSTTQQQTYNPAGAGYINSALQQGQNAAQLPFSVPQAPVAGFSPQQQQAFNIVGGAQGQAQPYFDQAANYFNQSGQGPNVSQFFNPYAGAVTDQLKNIFGQQQAQTTGQLTQAAGGVGADRIAVGQSELANQQGLAAGQTLAGLYAPSLQAAQQEQNIQQGAGYGIGNLGSTAQNATLTGANALLGTGGLQQQLSQAQMNSPYQLALAKAAFPYQQAQFGAGIAGALAPGLGGTTSGTGTTTTPGPSLLSQILGIGTAGVGAAGSLGAFSGSPSYGGGSAGKGDAYGGSSTNPIAGLSPSDYGPGFARGGSAHPFQLNFTKRPDGGWGYDDGGTVSDKPIDVAPSSVIPNEKLTPIQAHIPQLNLNPPSSGSGSSGSGDVAKAIGTAAQMAMMFLKRGGRINPKKFDGYDPHFADGGSPSFDDRWNALHGDGADAAPDEPYRMAGPAAMDDWRQGADTAANVALPPQITGADAGTGTPLSFAPQGVNRYSASAAAPAAASPESAEVTPVADKGGFAASPWAALMAAGLATAAGKSPFALSNIGAGGLEGLKTLESQRAASQKDTTIDQAAKRLEQEAKFHEDQYSKMTPYQKGELELRQHAATYTQMQPVKIGTDFLGHDIMATKDPKTGQFINAITGKPIDPSTVPGAMAPPTYNIPGPQSSTDEAALPKHAQLTEGVDVPEGVNRQVLASVPPGLANKIRAVDEGRMSISQAVGYKDRAGFADLVNQYDPNFDQTVWGARNKQQADLTTNGNAGKMILAVNQLLPHLKTASDGAEQLKNSSFPAENTVANWWLTATGDPRVKKFETVREVASMDAARLLRGSGQMAEPDIEFWRKNLASSGSPAQLQETIKLLADDLMGARITSIQQSYRMNMRKEPPDFVSKEAKEALETIKTRGTPQPSSAAAPPAAGGAAPAAATAKPDPATRFQQLTAGGMSKPDAYAKMHQEGY